jgi:dTDP-4-dehydrorhamnose 3,5-epimerase
METWQQQKFAAAGIDAVFVQDNHSGSQQGILCGLHYQVHQPQGKLVRVAVGAVFDVAVDLRRSSPTFGRWVGVVLSAENKRQLWIPARFAHGFYALTSWAEVLYKATDFYALAWDRTLRWDDPTVGIDWPLVDGQAPILSSKDAQGLQWAAAEKFG